MPKRVVVVASGDTERRALPHLCRNLGEAIELIVRQSPHGVISAEVAKSVIIGAYWELIAEPIDKAVVLVDADAGDPGQKEAALQSIRDQLDSLGIPVLVVAAKWHLEAWFFGDADGLRRYLGRDLGRIDTGPDGIERPKYRLRDLLGGIYTAVVAEEIAASIDPETIRGASPSFARFERAVLNGPAVD